VAVRVGIASINMPAGAARTEWAQCKWAQGNQADPRLPEKGTWQATEDGLVLLGPGIDSLKLEDALFFERDDRTHGNLYYKGSAVAGYGFSGHGEWEMLLYTERPPYNISDGELQQEYTRRDGICERILRFAFDSSMKPKDFGIFDFKNFLGSLDSKFFSEIYPDYYRDRPLHWRGHEMVGWELNYYFIGVGFQTFQFAWGECCSFIYAWKMLCYGESPSAECLFAARCGFDESARLYQTLAPAVASRIMADDADWNARLKKLKPRKPRS
jgi:hypothetical protein